MQGEITSWNDERGFGFIQPENEEEHVFIHIKAFGNTNPRPLKGQIVRYEISFDPQGRARAERARVKGARPLKHVWTNQHLAAIATSTLFFAVVYGIVLAERIPMTILIYYLVISATTIIAYARDKSAAQSGHWRIAESTLHLFSLAGGWPGAIIAQQFLRHKSKKVSFRIFLWITILLNCALLGWLISPIGAETLSYIKEFKI